MFKIILLGESGAGKSHLLHRYCEGTFGCYGKSGIGIEFVVRTIELDGKRIKLQIVCSSSFSTVI